MNITEEFFWKANLAFQCNRLNESYEFLSQAIQNLNQSDLSLEQVELIWLIIPKMILNRKRSIEKLVYYHHSMPIETDEFFDYLTKSYVNQLEQNQVNLCQDLIQIFDQYLIQDKNDIDHIHLKRLQSDLYLHLSYVSRPYQSHIFYNQHRKLLTDIEHIINTYKKS